MYQHLRVSRWLKPPVGPGGAVGRSKGDAPEIDGKVHLSHRFPVRVGDIVTAKITAADAYDLHGTVV